MTPRFPHTPRVQHHVRSCPPRGQATFPPVVSRRFAPPRSRHQGGRRAQCGRVRVPWAVDLPASVSSRKTARLRYTDGLKLVRGRRMLLANPRADLSNHSPRAIASAYALWCVEWVDAVRPRRVRAGTEVLSVHSKARNQLSRKLAAGRGTQSIMQVLEASNSDMRVQVDELGRLPGVSARPSHAFQGMPIGRAGRQPTALTMVYSCRHTPLHAV